MRKCYWTIVVVFLMFNSGRAQDPLLSTKSKKAIELYTAADNFRVRGQFDKAIELLKEALEKDKKFEEAYYRLALTYRSSGDLIKSIENFELGLNLTSDIRKQKTYSLQLGDALLRMGNYQKSLLYLDGFLKAEKLDKAKIDQAAVWRSQAQYGADHAKERYDYFIKPLSDTVNAFPMQYFPTLSADDSELIFTVRYGKAHDDNEDIFICTKDEKGNWKTPVPISDRVNSTFREGASTISADGRKLIFTICGPRGCDLFETVKVGKEWKAPVNLGAAVNSPGWEAQPSLSADGSELYFISDRRGGLGGYDIWYSKKGEDGRWMRAVNVGAPVNTRFDEIAPYIHVNNQNLYYASNGLPGYGSYDIYVSERKEGAWMPPTNMGAPLNDYYDQYSFTVSSNGKFAYYSKEEGKNQSKIYRTVIPENFQVKSKGNVVSGTIRDAITKQPLNAIVELFDLKTNTKLSEFSSDSVSGEYLIVVPGLSEYALHAKRQGYLFESLHFDYNQKDQSDAVVINMELKPILKNSTVVLNNIFFGLNEFQLTEKSKAELDEVFKFLTINSTIAIEISGHTDNTGSEEFNQNLSFKRAESVVNYLKEKGIDPARLNKKGYGSKRPVKPNDSEQNRQLNRRIEFTILRS